MLELNDEGYFDTSLLYELSVPNDRVACIAGSHLIQGECAIVLEKSGDIFLINEEVCGTNQIIQENDAMRVAAGIQPLWDNNYSSILGDQSNLPHSHVNSFTQITHN